MAHGAGRGGAVPVLHARGKPDDVARPDLLDRATLVLHPAAAGSHDQGLAERMGVPGRARAGLEGDGGTANARRGTSLERRIDPYVAGEIIRRSFAGRL